MTELVSSYIHAVITRHNRQTQTAVHFYLLHLGMGAFNNYVDQILTPYPPRMDNFGHFTRDQVWTFYWSPTHLFLSTFIECPKYVQSTQELLAWLISRTKLPVTEKSSCSHATYHFWNDIHNCIVSSFFNYLTIKSSNWVSQDALVTDLKEGL